jgi:predicted oxidoreductase
MTFPVGAWRQRGYINTRPQGHRVPRLKVRTWGPPPVVHSTGTHPFRISDVGDKPIKDDDARMRMAMARE